MSTVIKGGTIVTADRTYKSDVLVDGGKIMKLARTFPAMKCWTPMAVTSCRAVLTRMCIWKCRLWARIPQTISRSAPELALLAEPPWWWISAP